MAARRRVAGFCFDHMHMGDLLRRAIESPAYEVVGVYDPDPARMAQPCDDLGIADADRFTDWEQLIEQRRPEVGMVCSVTADHALWCERLAAAGVHVLLEKPFAVSVTEAERAIRATQAAGVLLAVNWPLAWYPSHRTTARLIADGTIGDVHEVHYYDGNRGPQYHVHDKREVHHADESWRDTWWFQESAGGGSLLDYLGYGTTIATWFRDGELPRDVTAVRHVPPGYEVDLHSVVVATYDSGLSTFQTRWGTFTDPWVHQPQPFCGFVVTGSRGTIASLDYAPTVRVQTEAEPQGVDIPVDTFDDAPVDILAEIDVALRTGAEPTGPSGWRTSLAAQRIVDAAVASARTRRPVAVTDGAAQ